MNSEIPAMSDTPRTNAVAKAVGIFAAKLKDGSLNLPQFAVRVGSLFDDLHQLERELAAAKEDADRLDWLENRDVDWRNLDGSDSLSIRAVIDSARKSQP